MKEEVNCPLHIDSLENCNCGMIYFLGGFKTGSTNLAVRLKHSINNPSQWDPLSGFVNADKSMFSI